MCNGAVEALGKREERDGRDGRASKVEVINQDLISVFPPNRIIRDKQVRVLHVRQVSGGRKILRLRQISSNSTSDCVPLHCLFMPP